MKVHMQVSLYIVAAVVFLWAVALFMEPVAVHGIFSTGQYDPATTGLVGASLFAFGLLFLMAGINPIKPLVHASVIALGLLSVVGIFQMFLSTGMPQNGVTFLSLLIYLSIAMILFFSAIQGPAPVGGGRYAAARQLRGRSKAASRRRPAGKKRPGPTRTKKKTQKKRR
jgi:hypothetical protein